MYADNLTDSMKRAIDETTRRREKQIAYNKERGVDPQPLRKKIADITDQILREEQDTAELLEKAAKNKKVRDGKSVIPIKARKGIAGMAYNEILSIVVDLDQQMKAAAEELKFELAGRLRDEISELKHELRQMEKAGHA